MDFIFSAMNSSDPHMDRARLVLNFFYSANNLFFFFFRSILAAHPSIRKLYGHAPITALYALACWTLAFGLTWLLYTKDSWILALALTVCVGPFIDMMGLVVIHEVSHNLVFPKPWQNRLLGIYVNSFMVVPIR